MSYCANCGRQRTGTARFCNICGAEHNDAPVESAGPQATELAAAPAEPAPPPAEWAPQADATRLDEMPGATRIDPLAAQPGQSDQFASWYKPETPAAPDWYQPTQTVRPAQPTGPQGYPAPGFPGQGYQATEYVAPGNYQPPTPAYGQSPYGAGTPPFPPGPPGPPGPAYQPGPATRPPSQRGRKGLFIVLAVLIVLAAGGGAYALATTLGKHTTAQPPASPTAHTSAPSASSSGTQPSGSAAPSASPSSSLSPSPSPSPRPTPSPSLSLVAVGAGVTGPDVPKVEALLSHRFQGINTHDYDEYAATLTARERADESRANFDQGYGTTQDSQMTLTGLTSAGSELAATVTFTSHQNPAESVDQSACNTWTETLYLAPQGSGYVVDTAPAGAPAAVHGDC